MGMPYAVCRLLNRSQLIKGLRKRVGTEYLGGEISCLMFGRAKMSLTDPQIDYVNRNDGVDRNVLSGWANDYLKAQGCDRVDSLDYSDFEKAELLLNLNSSILDDELYHPHLNGYDLILDYGTSEHVFNPAMSFFNAAMLLNEGGLLNSALPVTGWLDHGLFQFSPAFFYAVNREEFSLERLYFFAYDRASTDVLCWDGMSEDFREHVHGTFDGSFAANCMQFLGMPVMAWAVFRKTEKISQYEFMLNTHQQVYEKMWVSDNELSALQGEKRKKEIFNSPEDEKPMLFYRYLMDIRIDLDQIGELA